MSKVADPPGDDALWRFSLDFYALPGIAPALIRLQDRDGLDVNLILFTLWLGISGRGRLGPDLLSTADRAVHGIRTEIVEPLRRRLMGSPDPDLRELREGIKAVELSAEKRVQYRLAGLAGLAGPDIGAEARRADAEANLALYLGPRVVLTAEASVVRQTGRGFILRIRPSV
jgi:uncharacterized protein (TIGR02444 family)